MGVQGKKAIFHGAPKATPAGNVDVSGGGRWRIWQEAGTRIDAPIMGNGDMLAALAGDERYPQFWLTTNDFWQMESAANWEFFHDNAVAKVDPPMSMGTPKPLGRIVLEVPQFAQANSVAQNTAHMSADTAAQDGGADAGKAAPCPVEITQDLDAAITHATYRSGDVTLQMDSFVAATENELIADLCASKDLDLNVYFYFPDEIGRGCDVLVDSNDTGRGIAPDDMFIGMHGGRATQICECEGGVLHGYRSYAEQVDTETRLAFAAGFLGETTPDTDPAGPCRRSAEEIRALDAEGKQAGTANEAVVTKRKLSVHLTAGKKVTLVIALRSLMKTGRPEQYAYSRVAWMTKSEVQALRDMHRSWWDAFWKKSEISLDDELIEQRYYLSLYMMGSLSRDPEYPPNILGICTHDRMAWNGNYKINYNHQTPYLGLMVAGHFEQSDTHDAPYLDLLELAQEMSRRLLGHEGAYYPLGLGPHGCVSEALLLNMKSPAVHGALNMLQRYFLTEDEAYARRIYPFLKSVATFWEHDLVERDGIYHVVGDGMHERISRQIREEGQPEDPVNTLGYLRTFFAQLPLIAQRLQLDADKITYWRHIASHLAPFPTGTIRDITDNPTLWAEADVPLTELVSEELLDAPVYYDEGKGGKWSLHFPGNVMQIYPAGAIGLGSDPEERKVAYNTVKAHAEMEAYLAAHLEQAAKERAAGENGKSAQQEAGAETMAAEESLQLADAHFYKAGAWNATNLGCLFFPAAARIGFDPEIIWQELTDVITHRGLPNGYLKGNPHGIEQLNTVPCTIHEMMLQSHEGVLRIFPVWPRQSHPNAGFTELRAYGAMKVSAKLTDGEVESVQVCSMKGHAVKLFNPWPQEKVHVTFEYSEESCEMEGELLQIPVHVGEIVDIRRA